MIFTVDCNGCVGCFVSFNLEMNSSSFFVGIVVLRLDCRSLLGLPFFVHLVLPYPSLCSQVVLRFNCSFRVGCLFCVGYPFPFLLDD